MRISAIMLLILAISNVMAQENNLDEKGLNSVLLFDISEKSFILSVDREWDHEYPDSNGTSGLRAVFYPWSKGDTSMVGYIYVRMIPHEMKSDLSTEQIIEELVAAKKSTQLEMQSVKGDLFVSKGEDTAMTYRFFIDSNGRQEIVAFYPESSLVVQIGMVSPTARESALDYRLFREIAESLIYFGYPIRVVEEGDGIRIEPADSGSHK